MRARNANGFGSFVVLLAAIVGMDKSLAQENYAAELPRIPPSSPAEAMDQFHIAEGYKIEAIASEPLVTSPVAIEWDAEGALFVCEMRGYSEDREAGISRITRLVDVDQDGKFDQQTIFADGLLWPTAVFPYQDGLFVADAPHVYFFRDTDGDGVADQKRIVLTGFSTSNVQGLMNSFRWGLDNRIHLASGTVGGKVRRAVDPESSAIEVRGRDLAIDPRDDTFELTSGGAQHGMCFDDFGRKFVSSNSDHIQQVMYEDRYLARNPYLKAPAPRLSIAADGPQAEVYRDSPVEPWRIVRTRLRASGAVPGIVEGGGRPAGYFTGATGVTICRGDAFSSKMRGMAIIGDVGSNLVHRKRLVPDGVSQSAERIDEKSEFVTSEDIWFRPAQFANAPDGSLVIIDVSREVIEHPASLPPEIKSHLDLTAGRESGRLYRVTPENFIHRATPNIRGASTSQCVAWLDHPNAWHRETASRLLFERQDAAAIPELRKLARDGELPQGRLHAMATLDGMNALRTADLIQRLDDENPNVRRHAIRLSESRLDFDLRDAVLELVTDDDIEVRYQLAWTLGYLAPPRRTDALAALIRRDSDSRWMRAAVLSSIGDDADDLLIGLLSDPSFRSVSDQQFLIELTPLIAPLSGPERALAAISTLPESDASLVVPIVGELMRGRAVSATDATTNQDASAQRLMDRMIEILIQRVDEAGVPIQDRLAAVDACRYGEYDRVRASLLEWIDIQHPAELQRRALTVMGSFRSERVAGDVIEAWPRLTPPLREIASEILFARPERILVVFGAINDEKISPGAIGKSRFQVAAKTKNAEVSRRATAVLNHFGTHQRQAVVDRYQSVLAMTGDVEAGRRGFAKHCSSCHKMEGVGHEHGPSLASIHARGAETILVNVLDPNREVNPQYLNYVVLTLDGRTLTGMVISETATSVTLGRAGAATDTILRHDIEAMQSTGLSLMPEGIEESVDQTAMADIIAYLMQPQ